MTLKQQVILVSNFNLIAIIYCIIVLIKYYDLPLISIGCIISIIINSISIWSNVKWIK